MARTDNLTNFLTDIANSIRNKKETTEPILASEFDNEINNLASKYSPRKISFMGYEGIELDDELSKLDLSNVTNLKYMFYNCTNLESIDLSMFDTSNVNSLYYLFYGCTSLKSVIVNNLNTKNVTNMGGLFSDCATLEELDLSNFDTSNVTSLYRAFNGCTNLKKLNLSSWNTSKVTNMTYMFTNCKKLERLDIRNFDFSSLDSSGDYCMFSGLNSACLIIVKDETVKTWIYKRLSYSYTVKTVAELTEEEM